MSMYHLALYAHILGVLGLFVAIGLEWTSMVRMRRAKTVEQFREWASLHTTLDKVFPLSAVVILVAGLYMVGDVWGWSNAWINLSLAGLVVMGALGPLINGRRLRSIVAAADTAPAGPIPAALTRQIQDPTLWMSVKIMAVLALGVVYLMAAKPEAGESVTALAVALVVGWLWGHPAVRERWLAARQGA
ncbi:MAG TPA: DUF2269 family protein [Chloroflexota bacterium]|nr:DUF2269 family protein [Chloroflexota bacterium]